MADEEDHGEPAGDPEPAQGPGTDEPAAEGAEELDEAMVHPAPEPAAAPGTSEQEDRREREARQWAVGAHLSALVGLVGIPAILGPLVVWLIKKDEHPLVDRQGREALNFQLSLLIYLALGLVAFVVLVLTIVGILLIPFLLIVGIVFWVLSIVLPVVGAIKTSNKEEYRYPLTMRLIT